jgi:hypothetical protein
VRWANHFRCIVTLSDQGPLRTFGCTLHDQGALLISTLRCFSAAASPLVALLGLAGVISLLVKRRWAVAVPIIVPVIFFYCVMIVPLGFVYERYTLNAAIVALIPAGYVFYGIRRRCIGKKRGLFFLLAACMVVAVECCSGYVPLTIAMTGDAKRKLTGVLTRIVPAGSRILTHASYFSMANADAYRAFTFCSQDHWASGNESHRMATLIDHDSTCTNFVLADHDLRHRSTWKKGENIDTASLDLIATVRFPPWIERGSRVFRASHAAGIFFVAQSYYVYDKLK